MQVPESEKPEEPEEPEEPQEPEEPEVPEQPEEPEEHNMAAESSEHTVAVTVAPLPVLASTAQLEPAVDNSEPLPPLGQAVPSAVDPVAVPVSLPNIGEEGPAVVEQLATALQAVPPSSVPEKAAEEVRKVRRRRLIIKPDVRLPRLSSRNRKNTVP